MAGMQNSELLTSITSYVTDVGLTLLRIPVEVTEKFYFVYLLTFVGLAYFSYRRYYKHRTRRNFWQFLFPKQIYLAASAKVDYGVFLINVLLSPLLLLGAGLQVLVSGQLGGVLLELNAGQPIVRGDWGFWAYSFFILGYTMAADLSVYLVHRFHHRSDLLWPWHALHHSAQVMTPVTLFRKHPVWNVTAHLTNMLLTGLFQGAFIFVFFGNPGVDVLFGLSTVYVMYNFFGANLRHSHVWLHWGKPLSYVFISPAMHQIHHDPQRMNKNYGEVFAIWDWMFGSLYIPEKYEQFEIGLGEAGNPHTRLRDAYLVPFVEFARQLRAKFKPAE
ncbi:MAG: sterol desaturase family protein [Pseudomonadota bacterium]